MNNRKIIGTVGALIRGNTIPAKHEYGANVPMKDTIHKACWVKPDDAKKNNEFKEFKRIKQKFLADKYGQLVFWLTLILRFK
jgi:peptide chain release factor 3